MGLSASARSVKSIQQVQCNLLTPSTGTGIETRYKDVTIASVDVTKAHCYFESATETSSRFAVASYLLNATTVRLFSADMPNAFYGQLTVVEGL